MPSVTMPNWTSHLTGSGPEEHGVTANSWLLDNHPLPALTTDAEGYYPSIFKVLKEQVPNAKTAYYYNWKELIYPINKRYLDEVFFEEKDEYKQSYAKAFEFLKTNKNQPSLVFLYSVHADHAGHAIGWMTPPYIKAIEEVDAELGILLNKLKADDLYHDTHFLLITDHGGINKSHGGFSKAEMEVPWGIAGKNLKHNGAMTSFNSNKNTAIVLAKLFGIKTLPSVWTGTLPEGIFK